MNPPAIIICPSDYDDCAFASKSELLKFLFIITKYLYKFYFVVMAIQNHRLWLLELQWK